VNIEKKTSQLRRQNLLAHATVLTLFGRDLPADTKDVGVE